MALAFINSSNADATGTSVTCTKPTDTTNGDLMIALFVQRDDTAYTPASNWNQIATYQTTAVTATLYYKVASSEPSDYTWTIDLSEQCSLDVVTFRGGFNISNPIDVVSNTAYTTLNSTVRAASMNVTNTNSLLVFCPIGHVSTSASYTFTTPTVPTSDWVEHFDTGNTTQDIFRSFCSMTWTSSGATGDIDSTMSIGSQTAKHAFAFAIATGESFSISEVATLTETISTLRQRVFSVSETTTLTEAITTARGKIFSILETVSTSETFTSARSFVFNISESVGLTEVLVEVRKKWQNLVKSVSSWTNGSKNSSTWTNQNKNSSTWTDEPKS